LTAAGAKNACLSSPAGKSRLKELFSWGLIRQLKGIIGDLAAGVEKSLVVGRRTANRRLRHQRHSKKTPKEQRVFILPSWCRAGGIFAALQRIRI